MPPTYLLSLTAALAGVTLGVLGLCLIMIRQAGFRTGFGSFFVACTGLLLLTIGQYLRAVAPNLGWMDVSTRLSQTAAFVTILGVGDVFRRAASAPFDWKAKLATAAFVLAGLYSLGSPGGLQYRSIDGITHRTLPWGEVIAIPIAPLGYGAIVELVLVSGGLTLLTSYALRRLRRGERGRGLWMVVTMAFCWFVVARVVRQWLTGDRGPIHAEIALIPILMSTAFEVMEYHRKWAQTGNVALERLRRSEGMLAALVGHGQTLAGLLDPSGRVVIANHRALSLVGVSSADVVGVPFQRTPWWNHSSALQARLEVALSRAASGEPDRFQATHPRATGGEAVIDFSLTPFRGEDGAIQWLIAEGRDVTDFVRLQEHARAEQRLEVIGQLAGGVAHDFNNMLSGILGASELARAESTQPEVQENLAVVIAAAERAAALTKQLLHFARRGGTRHGTYSLHELLHSTVTLFERTSGNATRVVTDLTADTERVLGDPNLMQSAILNLLVNSRDAMPSGGTITIRTTTEALDVRTSALHAQPLEPGTYVHLRIADTGVGIAPDVLPRIFEPFYTTKEIGRGTGLGLAAVFSCVRDHRGSIEVSSTVGAGTSFDLLLPTTTVPSENESQIRPYAPAYAHGRKALLVDDEPIVRNSMTRMLKHLGYKVTVEESGLDALLLREGPPEVAVLDFHMPQMNGAELARELRARFAELPIVIMSGNFGDKQLDDLKKDARTRLLPKPARREELVAVLLELGVITPRPDSLEPGAS